MGGRNAQVPHIGDGLAGRNTHGALRAEDGLFMVDDKMVDLAAILSVLITGTLTLGTAIAAAPATWLIWADALGRLSVICEAFIRNPLEMFLRTFLVPCPQAGVTATNNPPGNRTESIVCFSYFKL